MEKVWGILIGFEKRKGSNFLNANFYLAKREPSEKDFVSNEEIQKGIEKALRGIPFDEERIDNYPIGDMGVHFFPDTKAIVWTSYYPFDRSFVNMKNFLEKKGVAALLEGRLLDEIEKRFGEVKRIIHINALQKRERQINRRHGKKVIVAGKGSYSFAEAKKALKKSLRRK